MKRRGSINYTASLGLAVGTNVLADDKENLVVENKENDMKNIYIINGSKAMWGAKGELNKTLCEVAKTTLEEMGKKVEITKIDDGYEVSTEADKIIASDAIIWQTPVWWMGLPWIVKKYIDEVFMEVFAKTGSNDGRHRVNPNQGYGSGGKLNNKYMLSTTWNAPLAAFTEKDEFFEGVGFDKVFYPVHKAMEFTGMKSLPSFMCNDVIKNPQVEEYIKNYQAHLKKVFS